MSPATRLTGGQTARSAEGAARQAANSEPLNKAARLGFVAKGVVYALIGVLAFQIALGDNERADQKGALQKVAEQPFGTLVLWLMFIGFIAYALWRFSEALWGRRDETDEKKRTIKRIGSAANGVIYLSLGILALRTATGSSSSSQSGWTAKVLDQTGGRTIIVIAGLVIIAVAVGLTWRGLQTDFEKHLDRSRMSTGTYNAVRRLGQVGYVARGIVFGLVGVFVIKAALDHEPGKARGFDQALKSVASAPAGPYLLMACALGLICFGAYSVAEARYRRL
jgi:cbb3-type cytochrome oxidase subunit 3